MESVAAEVECHPGRRVDAARALQERGFRVLDVGATVSVQGPPSLWTSTFGVSFDRDSRTVTEGITGTYLRPASGEVEVPEELRDLIAEVLFVEPPEFFTT